MLIKEMKDKVVLKFNNGNLFGKYESDSNILFHITPAENFDSISNNGFICGKELGVSEYDTISFCRSSEDCIVQKKFDFSKEWVIFAIDYNSIKDQVDSNNVLEECGHVRVLHSPLKPKILDYRKTPIGLKFDETMDI